jgi:hypothetical protein
VADVLPPPSAPSMRPVGIDPAPKSTKGLAVFDPEGGERRFFKVRAVAARAWVRGEWERCEQAGRLLILGWDAPLGADFTASYTQRLIEKYLISDAFKEEFGDPFGKAAAVQGYCGCPHWTISLDVLGRPLPDHLAPQPDTRLPLLSPGSPLDRAGVLETHPAVALALCWKDGRLPKYKGRTKERGGREVYRQAMSDITAFLAENALACFGVGWEPLPADAALDDDYLDAQLSYLCVAAALQGKAILLGDQRRGGFTVPATERAKRIQGRYLEFVAKVTRAG